MSIMAQPEHTLGPHQSRAANTVPDTYAGTTRLGLLVNQATTDQYHRIPFNTRTNNPPATESQALGAQMAGDTPEGSNLKSGPG